jgi:hypothetical protein
VTRFCLLVGALGLLGSLAATTASAATACNAGVHPFGDVSARTFCGPARATLVVGGKTFRFRGGVCERGAAYISLNIGTVVLGTTAKPRPEYFGMNVGKVPLFGGTPATHDGTFPAGLVTGRHLGKGYSLLQATVTLAGGRTHGTFKGPLLGGGTATGTFHC